MKQINNLKLKHPGFILFEGLDFNGKTVLAKNISFLLKKDYNIDNVYNYNQGLIRNDIVEDGRIKGLTSKEKSEYFLNCYLRDSLPSNPCEFKEIIQDRYIPAIIFYSLIMNNVKIKEMDRFIKKSIKPKYIFLIECDYEERKRRAMSRQYLKKHEQESLLSEKKSNEFTMLYREIISRFNVPYKIIDTSTINENFSTKMCIEHILNEKILNNEICIENLFVDFEPRVYQSTSSLKFRELKKGKKLKPINVTRIIQKDGKYADIIYDGRHRAYGAWKVGIQKISAFVNYKCVEKIEFDRLIRVNEFGFKL